MVDAATRSPPAVEPKTLEPLVMRHEAGGVATLTLNRPSRFNALSDDVMSALQGEFDRLAKREEVRCVVLAAAGKAFCAGHDLKEMRANPHESYHRALFERCSRLMLTIRALPMPVIARVQGVATAAGCQLVAACDLAVAGRGATFAVSGVNLGLFCSTPAVALSRAISPKAAFDMLATGRFIDAETAKREGLVNLVVDDADLDAATEAYAAEIAGKSPAALRLGKRLFYAQAGLPLDAAYRLAGETMACNMMEPDATAGIDAFLNKRKGP